jgi:anti-sigma B factor antagonist
MTVDLERVLEGEGPIDFQVTVKGGRDAVVVDVSGELDVFTLGTLHEALRQVDLDGGIVLRMDLSNLRIIDSTGIGTMVTTAKRVRASGGVFSTICPQGMVRRVLEITGLVEYLQLDPVEPPI